MACYFFAIKWEFDKMGTHFRKNSEIVANRKHFPSSFWKKLNVFLCNFFAIKWEFDKMGTFFRISCYFGAKWEPILSRAYCSRDTMGSVLRVHAIQLQITSKSIPPNVLGVDLQHRQVRIAELKISQSMMILYGNIHQPINCWNMHDSFET